MIDDQTAFRRFAEIIRDHGVVSSLEYDRLLIDDKPSRWKIRQAHPSWNAAVAAALRHLDENGGMAPPPDEPALDERVTKLQAQIEELRRHVQSDRLTIKGSTFRFGGVSDTHIGSLYCDYALLNFAYKTFEKEGITEVFHKGDMLDGQNMYKGHIYELEVVGEDAQVGLAVDRYPCVPTITTYFIDGNHDRSFWKASGSCTGKKICERRPDLVYLGYQEADVVLGEGKRTATLRLSHPEDGTAYAISYKTQRYINELASGTKPDILLIGHYHKNEFLYYRGVNAFQAGCIQAQTPFMRARKISASQGFWIFEITVGAERVVRITQTFFPVRS